jgi:hypothetical protein
VDSSQPIVIAMFDTTPPNIANGQQVGEIEGQKPDIGAWLEKGLLKKHNLRGWAEDSRVIMIRILESSSFLQLAR